MAFEVDQDAEVPVGGAATKGKGNKRSQAPPNGKCPKAVSPFSSHLPQRLIESVAG